MRESRPRHAAAKTMIAESAEDVGRFRTTIRAFCWTQIARSANVQDTSSASANVQSYFAIRPIVIDTECLMDRGFHRLPYIGMTIRRAAKLQIQRLDS